MAALARVIKPVRLRITCDMDNLDYMTFLDLPCYFNLCSCDLVIMLYDITRLGCFMFIIFISQHTYMTLFHMIQCVITLACILSFSAYYRHDYYSFIPCSTYIVPLLSSFYIIVSSFRVCICWPLLTDLDFSASELEETDEPLFKGTQGDYQA